MQPIPAGTMDSLEITVKNDGDFTIAVVKLYPNVMEVKVDRRKASYAELFNEIQKAFLQVYAHKDVQF